MHVCGGCNQSHIHFYRINIHTHTHTHTHAGLDVIGQAKTGSGKTAAFALPMLQTLSQDPFGCFGVVLTPTRELAVQIAEQFEAFGSSLNLVVCVVVGGMDQMKQQDALGKRPHIIIATPGRLAGHIRGGIDMHCKHVRFLVCVCVCVCVCMCVCIHRHSSTPIRSPRYSTRLTDFSRKVFALTLTPLWVRCPPRTSDRRSCSAQRCPTH
jgi:hypothetical protein